MNNLLKELVDLIFRFLTVQEATQIMHLSKKFRWAGGNYLERLMRNNGFAHIRSLSAARRTLTRPLGERLIDLYCVVSDIENFFRGEEWNISPVGNARLQVCPATGRALYDTEYLPLTVAHDSPMRARTHFTTMTPDLVLNVRGQSFNLGDYLRWRDASGQVINRSEVVDALELLQAVRELIDYIRTIKPQFLTLPDGTRLV